MPWAGLSSEEGLPVGRATQFTVKWLPKQHLRETETCQFLAEPGLAACPEAPLLHRTNVITTWRDGCGRWFGLSSNLTFGSVLCSLGWHLPQSPFWLVQRLPCQHVAPAALPRCWISHKALPAASVCYKKILADERWKHFLWLILNIFCLLPVPRFIIKLQWFCFYYVIKVYSPTSWKRAVLIL